MVRHRSGRLELSFHIAFIFLFLNLAASFAIIKGTFYFSCLLGWISERYSVAIILQSHKAKPAEEKARKKYKRECRDISYLLH
uniref:Uncharacterized protein n=1 Tax=Anopheles darlingi TaxID=43151 RepID=A0A2M4D7Y6_ANODA